MCQNGLRVWESGLRQRKSGLRLRKMVFSSRAAAPADGIHHGDRMDMKNTTINRHPLGAAAIALLAVLLGSPGWAQQPLRHWLQPLHEGGKTPVVTAMALDPRGEFLAVACDDCSIRLLDTDDLSERQQLIGHRDLVRSLSFRPDGLFLASAGNDGRLTRWDRNRNWQIDEQVDDLPSIFCVRYSPCGQQLAAVGFDPQLMLFDRTDRPKLRCGCSDLRSVSFSSAGDRLAVVGRSGKLHLFDPRSGEEIGQFATHASRARDIAFLPEANAIATVGEDGAVTIFDLENHQIRKQTKHLPGKLFAIAAIDGTTIAVAGSDNRIRILNTESGNTVGQLDIHDGSISSLLYSKAALYSGGFDGQVCKTPWGSGEGTRVAGRETATER